jgi:non-heme chloroperoxidase
VATAEVWRSSFRADYRAALRAITDPVLIIRGAADQSAPIDPTGLRTSALVPRRLDKEYPTAGHGLYVTHAEQPGADLLDFING